MKGLEYMSHANKTKKELGLFRRKKREHGCNEGVKTSELSVNIWQAFFEGMIRLVLAPKVPQVATSRLLLEELKQSLGDSWVGTWSSKFRY